MKALEEKIRKDGRILEGNVLKVDSFLNHQIDVPFMDKVGEELYRLFGDCGITKIVTIEVSGIGVACLAARYFNVPVVYAKKSRSANLSKDAYSVKVQSFTHGGEFFDVMVAKEYLSAEDTVLIIDDFLANGNALIGLKELVEQSGATVAGAGIVIEKAYQEGGDRVRATGMRVESLARIRSMDSVNGVQFCEE